MSTATTGSLKITIKRPQSAPSDPSPAEESPAPEQKKRKRAVEDDGAEDETPPLKRTTSREKDTKGRSSRRPDLLEWTPSPPEDKAVEKSGSKSKRRRSVYDEDQDYDPERVSPVGSAVIDVEGEVAEEPPKKKPARPSLAQSSSSRPKRKSKPSAKVAAMLSDEEDDYTTPPPTPPRNPKPAKGKGRTSTASITIVARDQRKLPTESGGQAESSTTVAVSATVTTTAGPPAQAAPVEPPKPKLPPIKKKSMLPGTPGSNESLLPAILGIRDDTRTPVNTNKANDMYNQLFSSGGSRAQKDRERYDARRQELEAMRAEARKKREGEAKNTFDMLAHSAAMNRFEGRLKDRRNWPSPSQIGSAFLMLKRYRHDL